MHREHDGEEYAYIERQHAIQALRLIQARLALYDPFSEGELEQSVKRLFREIDGIFDAEHLVLNDSGSALEQRLAEARASVVEVLWDCVVDARDDSEHYGEYVARAQLGARELADQMERFIVQVRKV